MSTAVRPGPGRPRDERLTQRIVEATLTLIAEQGYDAVSIEGVARAAGVSRPTVYKRWPSLADLRVDVTVGAALEVMAAEEPDGAEPPDRGSLHGDLLAVTEHCATLMDRLEAVGVLEGLVADVVGHPHLARHLVTELLAPDPARHRALLARAVARGEADDDAEQELLAAEALIAFGLFRRVVAQQRPSPTELDQLVGVVVRGLAPSSTGDRGR